MEDAPSRGEWVAYIHGVCLRRLGVYDATHFQVPTRPPDNESLAAYRTRSESSFIASMRDPTTTARQNNQEP